MLQRRGRQSGGGELDRPCLPPADALDFLASQTTTLIDDNLKQGNVSSVLTNIGILSQFLSISNDRGVVPMARASTATARVTLHQATRGPLVTCHPCQSMVHGRLSSQQATARRARSRVVEERSCTHEPACHPGTAVRHVSAATLTLSLATNMTASLLWLAAFPSGRNGRPAW